MNILFVYSFTRLWNSFNEGIADHRPVYVTFRREYAYEPVSPLYVFSKRTNYSQSHKHILSEDELLQSFRFTRSLDLIKGNDEKIIRIGRQYEIFYLDIFKKESIECIVNWNLGYGFQKIGHLLAKKLGIETIVMEGGLFRPYTLTIEQDGVNANSILSKWSSNKKLNETALIEFKKFQDIYINNINKNKEQSFYYSTLINPKLSKINRVKKEIKQRFVYNFADYERYHHNWSKRLLKFLLRSIIASCSYERKKGEKIITFFLSSVYDPQLDIPTHETIIKYIKSVLDGFKIFRHKHPEYLLLIKEHPLDEKRTLFWNIYKQTKKNNVLWTTLDAQQLIQISDGIITITSTIGIDVLMQHKPLLCLGNSCYKHEGITLHSDKPYFAESIAEILERLIKFKPNDAVIDAFLCEAFNKTQIPLLEGKYREEEILKGFIATLQSIYTIQK